MTVSLYQIPKLKFFEMFTLIKEQHPLVLNKTKGYYKKYKEFNSRNVKTYKTRIK